jgi:riboflavin kinase/FMN adenylyltransferase
VYAGVSVLPDGRELASAISVGTKPTFDGVARVLESHFLGAPDLRALPEYGWKIRVRFTHWLRDQVKFDSLDDLKRQLVDDCSRAAGLVLARQPGSRQGAVYA